MSSKTAHEWRTEQTSPCYAIISAASDSDPVKAYTLNDGRAVAYPLYAGTPYAQWHPVMPYLVAISPRSGFLKWIDQTQSTDWGWLFSSDAPQSWLIEHFISLAQATMPDGERVFFRYWDGDYLSTILRTLHEPTCSLLPGISNVWLHGKIFTFQADISIPAKNQAWWTVPQYILDIIEKEDHTPLITNIMTLLQETRGDIWLGYTHDILEIKVSYFIEYYNGKKEELFSELCQQLSEELKI